MTKAKYNSFSCVHYFFEHLLRYTVNIYFPIIIHMLQKKLVYPILDQRHPMNFSAKKNSRFGVRHAAPKVFWFKPLVIKWR